MEQVATTADVAWHFANVTLAHPRWRTWNWCTNGPGDPDLYSVNDETYINGVMVEVDSDYYMGYVIEVVDRTLGTVTFIAIATYHGRRPDGTLAYDFMVYPHQCGTFFERTDAADRAAVGQWGVASIYGMFEDQAQARR